MGVDAGGSKSSNADVGEVVKTEEQERKSMALCVSCMVGGE